MMLQFCEQLLPDTIISSVAPISWTDSTLDFRQHSFPLSPPPIYSFQEAAMYSKCQELVATPVDLGSNPENIMT